MKTKMLSIILTVLLSLVLALACACNSGGGGDGDGTDGCNQGQLGSCKEECIDQNLGVYDHNECVFNCYLEADCEPPCAGWCHHDCRDYQGLAYSDCFCDCLELECGESCSE
jgi:hypothetical protein